MMTGIMDNSNATTAAPGGQVETGRSARKRKQRRRRKSDGKRQESVAAAAMDIEGVNEEREMGGMKGISSSMRSDNGDGSGTMPKEQKEGFTESLAAITQHSITIDCLSDPLLMNIAEMLGTPPKGTNYDMKAAVHVRDVCSMSEVCQRWKKMVRSHDALWRSVCEWRWPMMGEKGCVALNQIISDDPRIRPLVKESKWLDYWMRYGCCRLRAGYGRKTKNEWKRDITMVVDVYQSDDQPRRVMSHMGSLWSLDCLDGVEGRWLVGARNREGDWSHYDWWVSDPSSVTPPTTAEIIQSLEGKGVYVDVTLIDKKTNLMSLWFLGVVGFVDDAGNGSLFKGHNRVVNDVHANLGLTYGKSSYQHSKRQARCYL